MESAGNRLKKVRERLNLRYRDVEQASHVIARKYENDDFVVALSRLSDIENKGTAPSLFRLYSLCAIYRLDLHEVLRWYGLPVDNLADDALLCPPPSTHLLPFDVSDLEFDGRNSLLGDLSFDASRTQVLPHQTRPNGWLGYALIPGGGRRCTKFGIIGESDESMAPVLPPGTVVLIDDSRRRIARNGWSSEADRPIYFLETRQGFVCRWCNLEDSELLAIPHPSSTHVPQRYRYPEEIEIIGEVIGVAMPRLPARQSRTRS